LGGSVLRMTGTLRRKLNLALTAMLAAGFVFLAANGCSSEKKKAEDEEPKLMKVTFSVADMHCQVCALRIKEALEHYASVDKAYANFLEKKAWARYDPDQIDVELLKKAVKSLGFKEVTIVSNEPYVPEPLPEPG